MVEHSAESKLRNFDKSFEMTFHCIEGQIPSNELNSIVDNLILGRKETEWCSEFLCTKSRDLNGRCI